MKSNKLPSYMRPTTSSAQKASINSEEKRRKNLTQRESRRASVDSRTAESKHDRRENKKKVEHKHCSTNHQHVQNRHIRKQDALYCDTNHGMDFHFKYPICAGILPLTKLPFYDPQAYDACPAEWSRMEKPRSDLVSRSGNRREKYIRHGDYDHKLNNPDQQINQAMVDEIHEEKAFSKRAFAVESIMSEQNVNSPVVTRETVIEADRYEYIDTDRKNKADNGTIWEKKQIKAQGEKDGDREPYGKQTWYGDYDDRQEYGLEERGNDNSRPRKKDQPKEIIVDPAEKCLNLHFYRNEITSKPWGHKIEEMLKWHGDYGTLERNHTFIQWLFPTEEYSYVNSYAQPIQPHEAEAIKNDPEIQSRFLKAYKMMLDFYGLKLKSGETGEIEKNKNWSDRLAHLNRTKHNQFRVTRIIRSLAIFGFGKFQQPLLDFLMKEAEAQTLSRIGDDVFSHWFNAVENNEGLFSEGEEDDGNSDVANKRNTGAHGNTVRENRKVSENSIKLQLTTSAVHDEYNDAKYENKPSTAKYVPGDADKGVGSGDETVKSKNEEKVVDNIGKSESDDDDDDDNDDDEKDDDKAEDEDDEEEKEDGDDDNDNDDRKRK